MTFDLDIWRARLPRHYIGHLKVKVVDQSSSLQVEIMLRKRSLRPRVRACLAMAAMRSRCGHYIFELRFLLSIYLSLPSSYGRNA